MPFDAHSYHVEHSQSANYLASPTILTSTMWQHTDTGIELVNETDLLPFVGVLVGHVSPFRLKCGPAGNHFDSNISSLAKGKYQFHLCRLIMTLKLTIKLQSIQWRLYKIKLLGLIGGRT